jgi:predicted dehydrogenase
MSQANRRTFLKQAAVAGAGFWAAGGLLGADKETKAANEQLQIACIGVGGKGSSDTDQAANHGRIVALCDIDDNPLNKKATDLAGKFSDVQKFNDYREMFAKMGDKIDAVTVSTADHSHAPASLTAMKLGKHVYCQKPLTHTVAEARQMRETAAKQKVCTQMGNQGTAENGLRRAVEIIRAGVLGGVTEVHVWTNRPIWPQGAEAILMVPGARDAAYAALHGKSAVSGSPPTIPAHVHWDLFLGTAPERPYASIYHPFSWRGWWDYGTGAIGDMACHTANMAYMALKLGQPTAVNCEEAYDVNPETGPMGARVLFNFPAREGMPEVKFYWHEGINKSRKRYLPPDALLGKVLKNGQKLSDSGSLLVGEKGILFSPNDYGAEYTLVGEGLNDEAKKVPESLPRNGKGDDGMKAEWVQAIKAGKPEIALSNFDYAGQLTEAILLGNVAIRLGKKFEWDAANLKAKNAPEADKFIKCEYRSGWTV